MKYKATISYIVLIVLLNSLFTYLPYWHLFGELFSPADFFVGLIYVIRDFVQREIRHKVIIAMIIGCGISWVFAQQQAAIASVAAFAVGETLDWLIYTYTKKPLSQRILWSSAISAQADSVVNLYLLAQLNWVGLLLMVFVKMAGVFALWGYWRIKRNNNLNSPPGKGRQLSGG